MKVYWLGVATAFFLLGCAGDPAPLEQMKLTERTLEQAARSDAAKAQSEFEMARQRFELAQKNMLERDYKRARVLAEQAELDARLAEAKALRKDSDQAVQVLNQQIEQLRKQLAGAQ